MIRQCLCRVDRSVPIRDIRRDQNRFCYHSREFFREGNNIDRQSAKVHIYAHNPKRDTKSSNMLILRRFHLRNRVCRHKVETLRYILALYSVHRWGRETYCRDRQLPYNLLHHFRQHNRDIHRNGNWRVCREHWHSEIGHRDMAENLFDRSKKSLKSR
jgi:hypothetical protein